MFLKKIFYNFLHKLKIENPKSILATGLSGLVGSRIVELLPQFQFTDISLDTGFDLLRPDSLRRAFADFTGDTIIHLAAFTDTNAAWLQRGDKNSLCYRLNVEGTQNILDLCAEYHKYLIHISTDFVFDGTKQGSYTEQDSPNPLEWYGQTKYEAEKLVTASGLPSAIVRIAFPYRAIYDAKTDLVRKIIEKLKNGQTCNLFSDQITTPTFVDDIAHGLEYFIQHQPRGIFHLVASSSQSVYDMGRQVASVFAFDQNLIQPSLLADYLKTPDARPYAPNLALSNTKISDLGIRMSTLSQGLEQLCQQL